MPNIAQLLNDIEALHALVSAQSSEVRALRDANDLLKKAKHDDTSEIQRLKLLLAKLQRMLFGQKSEKLQHQIDQLELELEELHINGGERASEIESLTSTTAREPVVRARKALPEHLPRETREHLPESLACPDCGGAWKKLGEDVSEVLEHVPASLRVVRHVRPRLACACCDRMAQAPAPTRPIARSFAGAGLLAHVMVSKYADHTPLYRQCRIYEREGVALAESTLADWVGASHQLLAPLMKALSAHVFSARKLHTDDTPVAVLMPGTGKTRHARLWTYVRDDRPSGSEVPPAVWLRYSSDRKGIHPQTHLQHFSGVLQADAFAGYDAVYETGRVIEAACWAHARRKFYDVHQHRPTPLTAYVLAQISALYAIEQQIRGQPPDARRRARQAQAGPIVDALHAWLKDQLLTLSRKAPTADAIRYALNQWQALTRYVDDGEIEIDNSAAERSLRGIALGRKNYLFMGSDRGGERAATMYSLMETAKLNGVNPEAYLRRVFSLIADYPVNKVADLLPWKLAL